MHDRGRGGILVQNIIITGAANGIGFYPAGRLLAEGHRVTVLDLEPERLDDLRRTDDALLPMACGVRDRDQVVGCARESAERFGGEDCAIHNACRCTFDSVADAEEETYRGVLEVHYFGALHLARAVLPRMVKQHRGRVVFASSMVAVMGSASTSSTRRSPGPRLPLPCRCRPSSWPTRRRSAHVIRRAEKTRVVRAQDRERPGTSAPGPPALAISTSVGIEG